MYVCACVVNACIVLLPYFPHLPSLTLHYNQVWKDLTSKDERGNELVKLQDVISQWRHRVALMEGNGLEGMEAISLRKLVALQGLGYERANAALQVVDNLGVGV